MWQDTPDEWNLTRLRLRHQKHWRSGRPTHYRHRSPFAWNIIERLLKEWQPDEIIVGLPLNMDGTEQPLTARARKFANRIHGRFGVEVKLHDERLSTVEARSGLFEQGGYRALNKGKVDSASAVIILESYFEQGY